MTEEMNTEIKTEKKCECICCSQGFRDVLKIALGSFVGVFLALSLFAALHKPPVPPCPFVPMMRPPMCHGQHFDKFHNGDFKKIRHDMKKFEKQIPVRVETDEVK